MLDFSLLIFLFSLFSFFFIYFSSLIDNIVSMKPYILLSWKLENDSNISNTNKVLYSHNIALYKKDRSSSIDVSLLQIIIFWAIGNLFKLVSNKNKINSSIDSFMHLYMEIPFLFLTFISISL